MNQFSISGYVGFHKKRKYKRKDGVICFVKRMLTALKIVQQDAENYDSTYVENRRKHKLTSAAIHRHPKQRAPDHTALHMENKSVIQNKDVVIVRDLNFLNVDWTSRSGDYFDKKRLQISVAL